MVKETRYEQKFAWRTLLYAIGAIVLVAFLIVIAYGLFDHLPASAHRNLTVPASQSQPH